MVRPHPACPDPVPGQELVADNPDLFWSLSFAVTGRTWERIGGFCEERIGYGGEDTDFVRLATRAGAHVRWLGAAPAYHRHSAQRPPVPAAVERLADAGMATGVRPAWPRPSRRGDRHVGQGGLAPYE
ncbi:glycosyltransferase family 2 protein [Streptomyces sp. NPDC019443]|uniref:glycosyltransferase family 2 protein n=1 Tax=Streptomyces sp. NPDC019443 TaxID=3365061 RepID=UPI00379E721C